MAAQTDDLVLYNHEYEARVRVAFVGAGGHAYRNVYPAFRYAPVELAAVCDLDEARAGAVARTFGAAAAYTDYAAMLAAERPDAVFIVTSYTPEGRVQATDIAMDALAAGAHVWMEKPTAATLAEVRALQVRARESGRFVMTGLKKIFFPSIVKAKEIIGRPEFGPVSSAYIRYPQAMPRFASRGDAVSMLGLLDHIYHPAAVLQHLMGPIERFSYEWEPAAGASIASIRFRSGAIGCLHFAAGSSGASPLERLEVIGKGANLVVENGAKLTYYRPAEYPAYGRAASWIGDDETAPLVWEPEFSLGQLYNSNLFTLGYAQEIRHFCKCVLEGRPPDRGTLDQVVEIMKLFEAFRRHDAGRTVTLDL
jgi:predicted dehydrogenase